MNGMHDYEILPEQGLFNRDRERRLFSLVGWALTVLLIATTLGTYVCQYAAMAFAPWLFGEWWFVWIPSFFPLYGVGLPAMYLILRRVPRAPHDPACLCHGETCPKGRFGGRQLALIALVALGYMYIGSYIGNALMSVFSTVTGEEMENPLAEVLGNSPVWANILGAAILAPIGEELLFRKLLGDRLRRWGDKVAILVSATFFALFHGNLFQFFYALLLGLAFGYLYTRTGKIRYSIVLHAAVNLVGGVLLPGLADVVDDGALRAQDLASALEYAASHPLGTAAYVCSVILGYVILLVMVVSVVLTIRLRRRLRLGAGQMPLPRGDAFAIAMGNVGMAAATVLFVLSVALSLLA